MILAIKIRGFAESTLPSKYLSFSVIDWVMIYTGEEDNRKDERLGVIVHLMKLYTLFPCVRVKFRTLPYVRFCPELHP